MGLPDCMKDFILFAVVLSGYGHFITERGNKAFLMIAMRYYVFFFASLGIWLKPSAAAYRLNELDYYRVEPAFLENKGDDDQMMSSLMRSRIAIRTTLYQLVPFLSSITVFAQFTAGYPIYHNCAIKNDDEPGIFKLYFPPLLGMKQSYDLALRIEMIQEGLEPEKSSITDLEMKWVVKYRAFSVFVTQSRFFQLALGSLKFVTSVALISMDAKIWIYISVLVFLPYAIATAIPGFIFLASLFKLRDEDFRVLMTGSFEREPTFRKSTMTKVNGSFRLSFDENARRSRRSEDYRRSKEVHNNLSANISNSESGGLASIELGSASKSIAEVGKPAEEAVPAAVVIYTATISSNVELGTRGPD